MGRISIANIKKTIYYLKRNGIKATLYAAEERMRQKEEYRPDHIGEEELEKQRAHIFSRAYFFSIVVPAYHTPEKYLRDMVESVLHQSYTQWELVVADASEDDRVQKILAEYKDSRIRWLRLPENRGIADNTNEGIRAAEGDYIGLLDHDDVLEPNALYEMAKAIENAGKIGVRVRMLYTDEDKCNEEKSRFYEPNFKENFNLDLILSNNYICHFMAIESGLMKKLGLRKEFDGAQDYDLVLRASAELMEDERQIVHIEKVLYHWRCHGDSTAENPQSKAYAYDAGQRALQNFADAQGYDAKAVPLRHLGFYTLQYRGDILDVRKDLGAVGGRILRAGRICGGRMDEEGNVFYEGQPEHYSGYLHRAVLTQDAEAVDIRCIRVTPAYRERVCEMTGIPYQEDEWGLFDFRLLPKDADYKAISLKVSGWLRREGLRILYLPGIERRI